MVRSSFARYAIVALAASGISGFFHAVAFFRAAPEPSSIASAERGIAASRGMDGFGTASAFDQFAAGVWRSGGAPLLATTQWVTAFAFWMAVSLLVFAIVLGLLRLLNDSRAQRILFGSAIVLVVATSVPPLLEGISRGDDNTSDLGLILPVELVDQVRRIDDVKAFANPSALADLLLLFPEGLEELSVKDSARLSANPSQWREEFRRAKWNTVLLSGPTGEYRPLLNHLMASPDWHLVKVTNHGFLFAHGPGLPDRSLQDGFCHGADKETAIYLAQISGYYDAIRRTADARECIERALKLAPRNLVVLSHAATFAATHKRWQDAISYSRKALEKDRGSTHAKLVQALALLETGDATGAEELVDDVLGQTPNDPYALFLSARICGSLKDHAKEAESLERLVSVAEQTGIPSANYQIYLGQAYARQSLADAALKSYRRALDSHQLENEQAEEVRDTIRVIESKATP